MLKKGYVMIRCSLDTVSCPKKTKFYPLILEGDEVLRMATDPNPIAMATEKFSQFTHCKDYKIMSVGPVILGEYKEPRKIKGYVHVQTMTKTSKHEYCRMIVTVDVTFDEDAIEYMLTEGKDEIDDNIRATILEQRPLDHIVRIYKWIHGEFTGVLTNDIIKQIADLDFLL
jgi:hypothetical protein